MQREWAKVRRTFDKEFKLAVVRDLESGKSKAQVSREHSARPDLVLRWAKEYRANPKLAFAGKGKPATADARVAELERLVGKLYAVIEVVYNKKRLHSSLGYKPPVEYEQQVLMEVRT